VACVVGAEAGVRPPLLFFVAHARDPQASAVGPALASAAVRAGWRFDCYYDCLRSGLHFGGGNPDEAPQGGRAGSLVAGAHHAEQLLWLATVYDLVALGDPASPLWPVFEAAAAETLVQSTNPAQLYAAAFERLGAPIPHEVLVVDAGRQGTCGLVSGPYLAPAFLAGPASIGLDVSSGDALRQGMEQLGASSFRGLFVDAARADRFPGGLDARDGTVGDDDYATFTTRLATRHEAWAQGVLLGGPDLVAAQLPKMARLRLLPLYGQPQVDCLGRVDAILRRAREPVYGVQYDDRDFFEVARRGHGLQVIDPDPPFDAATSLPAAGSTAPCSLWETEPGDDVLRGWADEGRVLVTLLFWAGMIRELDCIPRVLDLVARTGLRAGLLITAETVEHGGAYPLALLSVPPERGGVFGLVEPLLASTGRAVAAEAVMPPGTLEESLREATSATASRLPAALTPRGWWPLLDTSLVARRMPVTWRNGKPVLLTIGRNPSVPQPLVGERGEAVTETLRSLAYRTHIRELFGYRRPYDDAHPGPLDVGVADAVRAAGFSYMWTKSDFGRARVPYRNGEFVALSFTAGKWEGWSPFYTLGSARDFERAERRLLRSGPGWLVSTIDTPLWAMSGEVWAHGCRLHAVASLAASGGASGRLINTTPHVVARYARMLDERGLLSSAESARG
jgi:hypothetical protein